MTDRRLAKGELDPKTLRWVARYAGQRDWKGVDLSDWLLTMARNEGTAIAARQKRRRKVKR